jgi:hypothetical protein
MHLVGYLYEDYHDARSVEHKVHVMCVPSISCSILQTQENIQNIIKLHFICRYYCQYER